MLSVSHFAIKSHCAALIAAKWLFSSPSLRATPSSPLPAEWNEQKQASLWRGAEENLSPIIQKLRGRRRESPILGTALGLESFSAIYPETRSPKKTRRDLLTIIGNQTPVHTNPLHQYLHSGSVGRATVSGVLMKPIQALTFTSVQPQALSTHTHAPV